MGAGEKLVASRFVVETEVGRGGMGVVYRARDREGGGTVALKVLDAPDPDDARRFAHEAEVLSGFVHPAIVGYTGHGVDEHGRLFLAMEWLEGEDLLQRLTRGPIESADVIAMVARLADALGVAHARGIVHRDVKPSNVYLPDGDPRRAKLLDFGIAFRATRSTRMTVEGVLVGTPGYLSPEQIRSEAVDGRADVFSLGCVIYECLSHKRAFPGDDIMAIMGRILLDPVLVLSDVMDVEVPERLERLVDRMLAKDRDARPGDMNEVRDVLLAMSDDPLNQKLEAEDRRSYLTGVEQRLISVVAVGAPRDLSPGATWTAPRADDRRRSLLEVARAHGVDLEVLPDGSALGAIVGGTASDIAVKAARLALAFDGRRDVGRISVVVGRGVLGRSLPVGGAIDRAVALLEAGDGDGVRLGGDAAALLGKSFEMELGADVSFLLREQDTNVFSRPVPGHAASFVGRDVELEALETAYHRVLESGRAAVHLVTGAAGIGKSRLVSELLARLLRARPARLLVVRGDPLRAQAPLAAISVGIRASVGVRGGDGLEIARARVLASLVRALGAEVGPQHAPYLGELAGLPFEAISASLDARVAGDRMREALAAWISGLARTQPVIVVLEDLSTVDVASARIFEGALDMLADRTVFVVATAREPTELLSRHAPTRHVLGPLSPRTARSLVDAIAGSAVSIDDKARVVRLAGGHPFHLEELVRAAVGGERDLPDTVLAGVEARLARLSDEERLALRAASVYGDDFTRGAVAALLPEAVRESLPLLLTALEAGDLLVRGQRENLAFAQRVIRDAAYATLTPDDRARGHRRAAEWLERRGGAAPGVLAHHFERGGESRRAAELYRDAAEDALTADDLGGAVVLAEVGFANAEGPRLRGTLRRIAAEAHLWRGDARAARDAGEAARAMLDAHDLERARVTAVMADACAILGDVATVRELLDELGRAPLVAPEWGVVIARVAAASAITGHVDGAEGAIRRVEAHDFGGAASAHLAARLAQARAAVAGARGDIGAAIDRRLEAAVAFESANEGRLATMEWMNTAGRLVELGAHDRAHELLEEARETSARVGLRYNYAFCVYVLGVACSEAGDLDVARRWFEEAINLHQQSGDRRLEGAATYEHALVALRSGALDVAEARALCAVKLLDDLPSDQAPALAVLSLVYLARGAIDAALEMSARGYAGLAREVDDRRALIYGAHVAALDASGRVDDARAVLSEAMSELERQAGGIESEALRRSFWDAVPDHRALAAHARRPGQA